MAYTLYGSTTSPFVRRMRMLLENIPYEFKEMNIFEGPDKETLKKINPINQVPVFTDGDKTIWDSRQIFNYLNNKHQFQKMDWESENQLTAIEGAMLAGISLILMKRSGISLTEPVMYVSRQQERIESILDYLTPYVKEHCLKTWDFHTMSLYCFLEWARYRDICKLDHRPECLALLEKYQDKTIVKSTKIPEGK